MRKTEQGCNWCPRACGIDRARGEKGYCQMTSHMMAARAALHHWEEPCISGTKGSGAVFFSGCTLRCVFCQNHEIASGKAGIEISVGRLSEIFLELQEQGANNINLVTATHFLDGVIPALQNAKMQGLRIPVVYNTGGYECVDTIKKLEGLIDVWLPDHKYRSSDLAKRYSHAEDYPQIADMALQEMVRQAGKLCFEQDQDGQELIKKGVIVRHLVLPGCVYDSKDVLEYLWDTYKDSIYVSLMSQYTPLPHVEAYPELSRTLTKDEYEEVVDYARFLGMDQVYIQEGETAKESFIPIFDCQGIFPLDKSTRQC